MAILQEHFVVKEEPLRQEVKGLKTQLNTQITLNHQLSAKLEAERKDHEPLCRKKARHEQKPVKEEVCNQETQSLPVAVSEKLPEQTQNMSA